MSASPPFGMAPSLAIPIAATHQGAIAQDVGTIASVIFDSTITSLPVAIKVNVERPDELPRDAPLWSLPEAREYYDILHARQQLWVHVDYRQYRNTWSRLMGPVASSDTFLDHVQNRRSTRSRNGVYPYIRLVPVPRAVNTNAGHRAGGEGMEFAYTLQLQTSMSSADWAREAQAKARARPVVYADPFDLTKMLGIRPGTQTLAGVAAFHDNFFQRSM